MTEPNYKKQVAADFAASLDPDEWQQFVNECRGTTTAEPEHPGVSWLRDTFTHIDERNQL